MCMIPILKGKRGKRVKGTNYESYASSPTQILLYHIVTWTRNQNLEDGCQLNNCVAIQNIRTFMFIKQYHKLRNKKIQTLSDLPFVCSM